MGNATGDAEGKKSRGTAIDYTTFRLGIKSAKGKSSYFPVVVFGKGQKSIIEYVKKGKQVLVEGHLDVGESGRASVVADRVVFLSSPSKEPTGKEALRSRAEQLRPKSKAK